MNQVELPSGMIRQRCLVLHWTRFGNLCYGSEENVLVENAEPNNLVDGGDGLASNDVMVCGIGSDLLTIAVIPPFNSAKNV